MTSRPTPQCILCIHWVSPLDRSDPDAQGAEPTQTCAAYPLPEGIPDGIWWNRADHRQTQPGDHGVTWEARDGAQFPDWAMADASPPGE